MTSALDQKGLEAAALAYKRQHRNTCYPDALDGEAIIAADAIIRAYLSTVIPAEIAGVVEALRELAKSCGWEYGTETGNTAWHAATLIERLAASQAETRRLALEEVEAQAEQIMLDVANEWHRQIGIDEVLKSKLVKRIADTVATGVFSKRIRALIDQPSTEGGMDD